MPTSRSPLRTANLTGRVVAITGAGSGIGRELALLCADRGADVAIAAEAHLMYLLSRTAPPLARYVAARLAAMSE